jgi:hypothetical protein
MNILLGCNHLHELGGSEQYNYTLAESFIKQGYNVYVMLGNHTLKGAMSDAMKNNLGIDVDVIPKDIKFNAVFLSHNTTVKRFQNEIYNRVDLSFNDNDIYQVLHGKFSQVENPFLWDKLQYVAISIEVYDYATGFLGSRKKIAIEYNPINVFKFKLTEINKEPKHLYSLSQSQDFNQLLAKVCSELGLDFSFNNKHHNPTFDIQKRIKDADIVVSLGRGCFEAMAMGKNVIIADQRSYMPRGVMDGIVTCENFLDFLENNCSGRYSDKIVSEDNIIQEIRKYDYNQGKLNRKMIIDYMNADHISSNLTENI